MSDSRTLRTELLLGAEALGRLRKASVYIAGLGAVGATAAEALARVGVGRLRLADFDLVRPSDINRNPIALSSNLGKPKTEALAERLRDISDNLVLEPFPSFLDERTRPDFLSPPPDVLLDAIDSLGPKTGLLIDAHRLGIPTVSAMGAGRRTDPSRVRATDISQTRVCPLAHRVRERLRKAGIGSGILCVWSDEPPAKALAEPQADTLVRGRLRRPFGSLVTVTQTFGLRLAHEALRILLEDSPPGP